MKVKLLDPNKFYEGSFADEKIKGEFIDFKNKKLIFYIDACETDDDQGNSLFYTNLKLEIKDWWGIEAYTTEKNTTYEKMLSMEKFDPFDEILIYNITAESLILEGFGKKYNQWMKLVIIKPKIQLFGVSHNV